MSSDMAFECLLIARDTGLVCTWDRLLKNLSISTQIYMGSSEACEQLSQASVDLIVVDFEGDATEVLNEIKPPAMWHKPTVVAVSAGDSSIQGAHVMLRKPVTEESGAISLKAAYFRMLHDYRRHRRFALMSSAQATANDNRSEEMTITDIGDGGFGFTGKAAFSVGDVLRLRLLPPAAARPLALEARVRWTRNYGAAGCKFVHIPPSDRSILNDWLKTKIQVKKPLVEM